MNTFLSEKNLIILFCFLFTVSATFLFWQNKRELDPNFEKSWWTLSFTQPENQNSLAFTIANHSPNTSFHYQISANKTILSTSTIEVRTGTSEIITPSIVPDRSSRTSIIVTTDTGEQEIYK